MNWAKLTKRASRIAARHFDTRPILYLPVSGGSFVLTYTVWNEPHLDQNMGGETSVSQTAPTLFVLLEDFEAHHPLGEPRMGDRIQRGAVGASAVVASDRVYTVDDIKPGDQGADAHLVLGRA